jgi:hypothetical protein
MFIQKLVDCSPEKGGAANAQNLNQNLQFIEAFPVEGSGDPGRD